MPKFYKLIAEGVIVDAINADEATWMVENPRSLSVYVGQQDQAKGVLSSDGSTVWHLEGRDKFADFPDYQTVRLEEIGAGEFQRLHEEIDEGNRPAPQEDSNTPPEPGADGNDNPQTLIEQLRQKVAEQGAEIATLTECVLEMSMQVYG